MDQIKIGVFLKELRVEKSLTQEQLADYFNVSSRTVSRWENGNNMPDLSLLVELADYYNVEIRELIDGERKSENMNKEMEDTLVQVVQYAEVEKKMLKKKMLDMLLAATLLVVFGVLLRYTNGFNGFIPQKSCDNLYDFVIGFTLIILVLNALYLVGVFDKKNVKYGKGLCSKKRHDNIENKDN